MLNHLLHYEVTDKNLWSGRCDSLPGERFFQQVQCMDLRSEALNQEASHAIVGFCSDEGIRRNLGRAGAKTGPYHLRQQLAKLASHQTNAFLDIGNIVCPEDALEMAGEQLALVIDYCHQNHLQTLVFGGGHEVAWPHFKGLTKHYPKLGIINFDAHFDLRPLQENKLSTSGTPFWQIKQYCEQQQLQFDYCCLGIQAIANTASLLKQAQDWQVNYLTTEQIMTSSFAWQAAFLDDFMLDHDYLYLSICLDVFAEAFAPGVSAPQAVGLTPWQVLPLLKYIVQTGKVVSIDVAELSPPLDQDGKTSRLAAAIVADLLNLKE